VKSLQAEYFEKIYAADPDPWRFATSEYEVEKYRDTARTLEGRIYKNVLEVGCSIGVLTKLLSSFAQHLTAVDISKLAIELARRRCADLKHVDFQMSRLPEIAPPGPFDLIVLSEVCYYWSDEDLQRAKDALIASCNTQAEFVLVHWTPFVESYPQTGDAVHEAFLQDPRFMHIKGHRAERYRLDHCMLRTE
jgi:SAM-dependent methyltransferase